MIMDPLRPVMSLLFINLMLIRDTEEHDVRSMLPLHEFDMSYSS